jgi:hypothetical protein
MISSGSVTFPARAIASSGLGRALLRLSWNV